MDNSVIVVKGPSNCLLTDQIFPLDTNVLFLVNGVQYKVTVLDSKLAITKFVGDEVDLVITVK